MLEGNYSALEGTDNDLQNPLVDRRLVRLPGPPQLKSHSDITASKGCDGELNVCVVLNWKGRTFPLRKRRPDVGDSYVDHTRRPFNGVRPLIPCSCFSRKRAGILPPLFKLYGTHSFLLD